MPTTATALLALPRTTRAEPPATGDTSRTPGIARTCRATACHWSIDCSVCGGICTVAPSTSPGRASVPWRSGRATWRGGSSWMWPWVDSTRWMKLCCRPVISADMNTITATPIATPATMNSVCSRPSRRKRIATIHSNGCQVGNMPGQSVRAVRAGGWNRTRAPAVVAAETGRTASPSCSPSSTSVTAPPCRPSRTARRTA